MSQREKEAEIFRKYITAKKIVIADEGRSSRSGVMSILAQLGARPINMGIASTLVEAREAIESRKPDIVIADFDIGKGRGLELLQAQRKEHPESKKSIFVLLTGNASQSTVARAAEEDVDAFILKPFTADTFRQTIIKAALFKVQPPAYFQEIELGKERLTQNDLDGADAHFQRAKGMDPQPSLACFYLGQVKQIRKVLDGAQGSYESGLNFNKIHYRCLVGLYELFMELKMHQQAYEVVKRVSQYFPANPKRLAEVLRLAIITKSYEDVEKYYSIFCNIDERNETLVDYICAALVVCGKYYLKTNNRTRALELFQKAAVTSAGKVKILRELVQALIDAKLVVEGRKFMERFPADTHKSFDYALLDFQLINLGGDARAVLNRGRAILETGNGNDLFFEIMMERALEIQNMRMVENLLNDCENKFPALAGRYRKRYEEAIQKDAAESAAANKPDGGAEGAKPA